jgi:ketosteroid isomerase-like protein
MSEELKATFLRVMDEGCNKGNLDAFDELYASDIVFHTVSGRVINGLEAKKEYVAAMYSYAGDFDFAIEEVIVEGDSMAARRTFRGTHQATGKHFSVPGCLFCHLEGGKIAEEWNYSDLRSRDKQLGYTLVPPEDLREE